MILFLFILSSFITSNTLFAQGSLLLTPKRVVFEGTKSSESINLANLGKDTARYVISLIEYRMKEDGGFEEITQKEAGQFSAVPYIRFFPRTVTLAPNEAQVIRMQLNKKPGQMASGEYRSHLYVRAVPKPIPMGEKEAEQSATIGVKLVPVFGVSIPVIIRVGESRTAASITGLSITTTKEPGNLNLMLNRSGNMSIYGDIYVKHISPTGKSTVVAVVKGLAVYAPNTIRYVSLPLNKTLDVNYHSGKLVTQFINNPDSKDKKIVESELALF
jgi:hypothetical protein